MEIYSNTTRFALACNMSNKIIEPIQSRCAILRYAKLTDLEVLKRLLEVCEAEKVRSAAGSRIRQEAGASLTPFPRDSQVKTTDDGLSSLIFTAEGDMRQALNNLQSTHSGFGLITTENVFKVCDQPHPVVVQQMLRSCAKGDIDGALEKLDALWEDGYAAIDIVTTVFRVVKIFDECAARPRARRRFPTG